MTFFPRLPPHSLPNALTRAVDVLHATGTPIVDLSESNPTRVGIEYPADLLNGLSDARGFDYEPKPLGLKAAREAVAADSSRRGAVVSPDHVVLSASTSEMYSWLFKLLCAPGDSVAVPRPSYPLFEHLTRLEGIRPTPYQLEYHGRWDVDLPSVREAPEDTRALLMVSPNNPTGSYVTSRELDAIVRICRERGWALVVDEVFADYPLDVVDRVTDIATHAGVLTFTLGGASKSLGLPQLKLGWTIVGGPTSDRDAALAGLELIADTFLSVSTPAQLALPGLLQRGASVRAAIHERLQRNLVHARRIGSQYPSCSVLRVEGGWSAVVRVPATRDEETLTLELLGEERILVHPGYFFDLPHEAFIVVSLLPPEGVFIDAFDRTLRYASS